MREKAIIDGIFQELSKMDLSVKIMHVCGSHQESLLRNGLLTKFEDVGVDILQGPGCPVCVTTTREVEEALAIARAGIKVCAFGVSQQLFQRLSDHWATPYHWRVFFDQIADRHGLEAVCLYRHDFVAVHLRLFVDAQHDWRGGAIDVGIKQADAEPARF